MHLQYELLKRNETTTHCVINRNRCKKDALNTTSKYLLSEMGPEKLP